MQGQIQSRVSVLMAQNRYKEAEVLLKDLLAADATSEYYLAMLAECAIPQGKIDVAKQAIRQAIAVAPDTDYLYYINARIALAEDDDSAAMTNLRRAIAINPLSAEHYALLAGIQFDNQYYELALESANKALELNPEHLFALNTRSRALRKLKRYEESLATLQGAFREDPNNYHTHANYGWALLENGDYKNSRKHFKQSLQENPGYKNAQAGMREAIKARNPIYALFLKYSFFMEGLTARFQWGVVMGFFILTRILRAIAENNPALQPYLMPVVIILTIMAFSTWIIAPVGNLFLSFDAYGKYLLTKQEKLTSKFVAACFALFLLGLGFYVFTGLNKYLLLGAFGFLMMLPVSHIFTPANFKHTFLIYNIVLAALGIAAIATTFAGGALFNGFTTLFCLGFFAFQFAANYFIIR